MWTHLSNGLNYQIEHHLFPGVNHEHLPRLAPMVKKTCEEYGVPYNDYASMGDLLADMHRYYAKLGQKKYE